MILELKKNDDQSYRRELEDVLVEYKLGMMDPGRAVAAYERLDHVKRINLKKKIVFEKVMLGQKGEKEEKKEKANNEKKMKKEEGKK